MLPILVQHLPRDREGMGLRPVQMAGGPDVVRRLPRLVVGSNFVSCDFRRNLLPTDGSAIRWRVVATYLRGELADDRAPGGQTFYPPV